MADSHLTQFGDFYSGLDLPFSHKLPSAASIREEIAKRGELEFTPSTLRPDNKLVISARYEGGTPYVHLTLVPNEQPDDEVICLIEAFERQVKDIH